jgi:hypothetical protein
MDIHTSHALDQERASLYADDIVAYVNALTECGDYVTLLSTRKPSLSDYDVHEV